MVRDYETPTVPLAWTKFAVEWAQRLGYGDKDVRTTCSPDRYGSATVLRLYDAGGGEIPFVRRSSDIRRAAQKRQQFLDAARSGQYKSIEIDVAGYYVSEGIVPCAMCTDSSPHEEWQHLMLRDLLRVKDVQEKPEIDAGLGPEEADAVETRALDAEVAGLLRA